MGEIKRLEREYALEQEETVKELIDSGFLDSDYESSSESEWETDSDVSCASLSRADSECKISECAAKGLCENENECDLSEVCGDAEIDENIFDVSESPREDCTYDSLLFDEFIASEQLFDFLNDEEYDSSEDIVVNIDYFVCQISGDESFFIAVDDVFVDHF